MFWIARTLGLFSLFFPLVALSGLLRVESESLLSFRRDLDKKPSHQAEWDQSL